MLKSHIGRRKKKNLEGFEGLIEEGEREGGIKEKGNGRIEVGGRRGRDESTGGGGDEIWEGKGGKEGGKLLRVYSTIL